MSSQEHSQEQGSRKRARKQKIQHALLAAVAIGGVLSFGLVAPGALGALAKVGLVPRQQSEKSSMARARRNLIERGLLRVHDGHLELTAAGEREFEKTERKVRLLKKPRRWDRKWRMLIFDIPETRKHVRDKIRHSLREIGFLKVQDSVWLYPYDCEEFVTLLKADLRIGKDLLYLIVDSLEGDRRYRTHFKLPLE